jgi:hypothetical protein
MRGQWCFLVFGFLTGCAQPPTAELEIAAARVDRAQLEGAAQYAPEILLEAQEALSRAQTLRSEPNRYKEAVRIAATACLYADEARREAVEEKARIARSAARYLRESRFLLEESRSLDAEKVAPNAIESYKIRADTIGVLLEDGKVADAFAASEALKQELLAWLRELESSQ